MVPNILLERGDNSEKGEGVDVEIGGLPLFLLLCRSNAFTVCVGEGIQDSHPGLYGNKTLYHLYISDSF